MAFVCGFQVLRSYIGIYVNRNLEGRSPMPILHVAIMPRRNFFIFYSGLDMLEKQSEKNNSGGQLVCSCSANVLNALIKLVMVAAGTQISRHVVQFL